MSDYFRTACSNCGGLIEAPKSAAGMTLECPHCHTQTTIPKRSKLWLWVLPTLLFVGVGAAAYMQLINKPAPPSSGATTDAPAEGKAAARSKSPEDLSVGKIEIDQPKGSGLRYAVGTLKNDSDHPRYGITVEITLLDRNGVELPTKASDYIQMLEPRKEWRFRALVLDSKAASAKVASIREEE